MKVIVDHDLCQGIGNCVAIAPGVFTLDKENKAEQLILKIPVRKRFRKRRKLSSGMLSFSRTTMANRFILKFKCYKSIPIYLS